MDRRARVALILAVAAALARGLAAQNPTPASPRPGARDTTARDTTTQDTSGVRRLLYSDVFSGQSTVVPRVTLTKGEVYLVEVDPAGTAIAIHSARRPSQAPLFMVPLPDASMGTAADFLVVPPSTEDYLITFASNGDVVRIRIWSDPKESARYTRIHTEGFRLPILALGASAVYMPAFRDARSTAQDALLGYTTSPQAAYGAKLCLYVLPTGRILPDRTGGCAVAFTLWQRGAGRNFFTFGIEPEVVILRSELRELSVTPQLAFGNTTGGRPYASYVFYGLGLRATSLFAAGSHAGWQVQAVLLNLDSKPDAPDPGRVNTLVLNLQAGLILKL